MRDDRRCAAIARAPAHDQVTGSIVGSSTITSKQLTIVGDGSDTELQASPSTVAMTVNGTAAVTLRSLSITGGTDGIDLAGTASVELDNAQVINNSATGVNAGSGTTLTITSSSIDRNTGAGVNANDSTTLVITLSSIEDNGGVGIGISGGSASLTMSQSLLEGNTNGGLQLVDAAFQIVGNVFFHNGSPTSNIGGIELSSPSSTGTNRLDFNSIAENNTFVAVAGIQCTALLTASDDIVAFNTAANVGSGFQTQASSDEGCTYTYTITFPNSPTTPPGATNIVADPLFVDPLHGNLHVETASQALEHADPAASLTGIAADDPDGVPRVAPADIGAFQHMAN